MAKDEDDIPEDDPEIDEEDTDLDEDEAPDGDPGDDETPEETDKPDDEEDEDDPEDGADDDLPKGVRARLSKVTAKRRAAERRVSELESENARLRERSGENDPKVYLSVAERHGILPQLLDAKEAKGLSELSSEERKARDLRDLLDDLDDSGENEIELGGKSYTRGQLRKRLRATEDRLEELKERFGDSGKRLRDRTTKLLRLGLAAEKAALQKAKGKGKAAKTGGEPRGAARDDPAPARRRMLGAEARPKGRGETPNQRLDRIVSGFIH